MKALWQPFLLLLANATDRELARQVQYLKVENQILRNKLPKRIAVTRSERRRLLKFGLPLGKAIRHLIAIVSPRTFARWLTPAKNQRRQAPVRPGRPRTKQAIRDLVIRFADENAWGYTRILGELKKLGINKVSRSTVVNILRTEGFDPGPKRGRGTWHDFVKRHRDTLWACDFLSKKIWTLGGMVDCFVLFFMHIGSRRVHLAGISTNPDRHWMAERAREVRSFFAAQPQEPRYLIRDLDGKFTAQFDDILGKSAIKVVPVGPCAPNLNAHAERFILTLQDECLDHFLVFGEAHLRYLLTEFLEHYHRERPHQGRDNSPLTGPAELPRDDTPGPAEIACKKRLGGLLKHYHRQAA